MENRREFCMVMAHHLLAMHGARDIAVGVRVQANVPQITGFAVDLCVTRYDTRTPIVNLLQGCSENGVPVGNEIYTTGMPTVACIGIAKAQGVRYIYFVNNNRLCFLDTTPNPAPTAAQRQAVNLAVRPPGNERLQPALPDLRWVDIDKTAAARAASVWFAGLPVYNVGTKTRTALNNFAGISAAAQFGVAFYPQFAMAAPTAAVPGATTAFRDRLFMALVRVMTARSWQHGGIGPNLRAQLVTNPLAAGKNIAAVLVNQNNQIIGWAVNTNDNATTRHAETNAIQAFQGTVGTALPAGTRIYSTLDPCFMCAALYVRAGGAFCTYEQADPNMTNNTALRNIALQYHEPYSGPRGMAPTSIAQTLDMGHINSGLPRVPDYLRSDGALDIYSHAHERLVVTGMRAATAPDRALWQHVLDFLRTTGFLGEMGARPDLFLDDDVQSRRL